MPRPDELDRCWYKNDPSPEELHDLYRDRYDDCHSDGMGAIGWMMLSILVLLIAIAARLIVPMVQDAFDRPTVCAGYATECAAAVVELKL